MTTLQGRQLASGLPLDELRTLCWIKWTEKIHEAWTTESHTQMYSNLKRNAVMERYVNSQTTASSKKFFSGRRGQFVSTDDVRLEDCDHDLGHAVFVRTVMDADEPGAAGRTVTFNDLSRNFGDFKDPVMHVFVEPEEAFDRDNSSFYGDTAFKFETEQLMRSIRGSMHASHCGCTSTAPESTKIHGDSK